SKSTSDSSTLCYYNYYHYYKEVEMLIEKYKQNNIAPPLLVLDKSNLYDNNSILVFNKTSGEIEKLDNKAEESDSEYKSINNANNWDEIICY
ncbi:32018_t:CDS:1, partial [Racocetra persica]